MLLRAALHCPASRSVLHAVIDHADQTGMGREDARSGMVGQNAVLI